MASKDKRKVGDTSFDKSEAERMLRRRNSLPDLPKACQISHAVAPVNLSDLAIKTMQSPEVLEKLLPTIVALLQPVITASMETILARNLQPIIKEIQGIATDTKTISGAIQIHGERIAILEKKMESLESDLRKMTSSNNDITDIENKLDALEQYSRRNSLRFHNLKVKNSETTSEAVIRLASSKLKTTVQLSDIDRSHFANKNKTQILCKFTNYSAKINIYKARTTMKADADRIFITEDLTKPRLDIIAELQKLKKSKRVHSFWSFDGKIFLKKSPDTKPIYVNNVSNISSLF